MPEDGVEPLSGASEATDSTTATAERTTGELETFEPDEFWDSGDTQQFVGTSGSSIPVGGPVNDDVDERPVTSQPVIAGAAHGGDTAALRWRHRLRVPLPTTWIAAGLVLAALVATGALIVSLTGGTSYKLVRHSPASLARVVTKTKPSVAHRAKRRPAKRHVTRPRRAKPAAPAASRSSVSSGASSSSQPATSTPVQAQPIYHSSPSASAASDSGSSSSGGGSSSSGQSAGPTSPLGPGTSPSG